MNKSLKISTSDREAIPSRGPTAKRLILAAVIAMCSSAAFGQSPISERLPGQGDPAATRQRITSSEGPESVVVIERKQEGPRHTHKQVFVRSTSLLVRGAVVEDKLLKRPEFQQLGFVITRELSEADLILELRHDLFTKYVFTVVDTKTQTVITGGKLSSLGGTVAGKVAKRFVKEMRVPGP